MHHVQAVSHLVFSTPGETYIAIQNDLGRMPMVDFKRKGSCIEWLRADGGMESIDLRGSPSEAAVLQNFESDEGLIVAIYPDLSSATQEIGATEFVVISFNGVIEDAPDVRPQGGRP